MKFLGLQNSSLQSCVDPEILQFANSQSLSSARTALEEMGFQRLQVEGKD